MVSCTGNSHHHEILAVVSSQLLLTIESACQCQLHIHAAVARIIVPVAADMVLDVLSDQTGHLRQCWMANEEFIDFAGC